jgi:uncharacterized membrane protein YccF (DUF307 family)
MSMLGNIVWLVLGGFVAAVGYILGGLLMCITIIGIPFGLSAINLGMAVFAPFGKQVVQKPSGSGFIQMIFNILWLIFFGWGIGLAHLIAGILLCVTIIGIPFGRQHLKLIPIALFPFSYKLE